MTDREGGITLLGYICMALLINSNITGTRATACTDRTLQDNFVHVIPMCVSGTLRNTRLVIDSWDTGGPDVYSCTCTVTLDAGSAPPTTTTTVVVEEFPGIAPSQNCGSVLIINSTKSNSRTETRCTGVPATSTDNFGSSDMLTLTLSRADITTPWTSGHCIFISPLQASINIELMVSCGNSQGKISRPITITTTTTTTTTTNVQTTSSQPFTTAATETTTASGETTTYSQSRESTTYYTNTGKTTSEQVKCFQECHPQQGYPLSAVVAPVVVALLLIAISVLGHFILYKRRLTPVKQPAFTETSMTSTTPPNYDSLDLSRVEPPNIYGDTTARQMYVNTAIKST